MPLSPSSILVTGGKGFIGSRVVKALLEQGHKVYVEDLNHKEPVTEVLHGIIHLAAVSRVKTAEESPLECLRTNVMYTAECLQRAKLNVSWFLMLGSQEQGDNFYGMSKKFAEDFAKRYCRKEGIPLMIVKPPVVWGAGDNEDKLVPRMVAAARAGESLPCDVESLRIVSVGEVVEAILATLGGDGQLNLPGDVIRTSTLKGLMRYVAHPDQKSA